MNLKINNNIEFKIFLNLINNELCLSNDYIYKWYKEQKILLEKYLLIKNISINNNEILYIIKNLFNEEMKLKKSNKKIIKKYSFLRKTLKIKN